ncbi:IS3 family transposase, partial [Pontibacter harenae]|uniref:IS3 family transposase n=1 Tax=Pontibacter harenae TaxID=2894083 RepID=UPI001E3476FF
MLTYLAISLSFPSANAPSVTTVKWPSLEPFTKVKGHQHLLQGRRAVYGFIKENRNQFPVEKMCRVLKVSASGYYYWLHHPVSLRELEEQELAAKVKEVYQQSKCRYGSPRISFELREQGIQASRPRVARVMQKHQIQSIVRKRYRVQTTNSSHTYAVAENHLARDFQAAGPAEKWVSDLTYIRTREGWLYLTVVLDLADRKVVGWALSDTIEAEATTVAAFQMA